LRRLKRVFRRKKDTRSNHIIREYLGRINENYSTLTLKYDFLNICSTKESFLSNFAQEKITIFDRMYKKHFKLFYKIYLFKENYFNGFINLFKYFIENELERKQRLKIKWRNFRSTYTFKKKSDYLAARRKFKAKRYSRFLYKIRPVFRMLREFLYENKFIKFSRFLDYNCKIILHLYITSKNTKSLNMFNSLYSKTKLFGNNFIENKKKDYFLENMIEFSLKNRILTVVDVPDLEERRENAASYYEEAPEQKRHIRRKKRRRARKRSLFAYVDPNAEFYRQNKRITRITRLIYWYYFDLFFNGKRKDRFIAFFKFHNPEKIFFPFTMIDLRRNMPDYVVENAEVLQDYYAFRYDLFCIKNGPVTFLEDVDNPKYGHYESIFDDRHLFFKVLRNNNKIKVPETFIQYHYDLLYNLICKYDNLHIIVKKLLKKTRALNRNKSNKKFVECTKILGKNLKKKYALKKMVNLYDNYIRYKINFGFFPYTYKLNEYTQNVLNKYIYKDLNTGHLLSLKIDIEKKKELFCNDEIKPTFNFSFFVWLLKLNLFDRNLKFMQYENKIKYNFELYFKNIFLKKYLIQEKRLMLLTRKYLKDQIFNFLNNESIFYENYFYGPDNRNFYGRYSYSKLRAKKGEKREIDRLDPKIISMTSAIRPIINLIFSQNVTDIYKISHLYDFDIWDYEIEKKNWEGKIIKDFYMISKPKDFGYTFKPFIKDEVYKKKIYSLINWLHGYFFYENMDENLLNWFFPDDVIFENKMFLLLNSITFNHDKDTRLYTLYTEYGNWLYFNDSSFFYSLYNYTYNFFFYDSKNSLNIPLNANLFNFFNSYDYEEDFSLDLSDIRNSSMQHILKYYSIIGENNIMSLNLDSNYMDSPFPVKNKLHFDTKNFFYGDIGPVLNMVDSLLYVRAPMIKQYNPLIVYNYL
jgi:hypothetical protein